MNFRINTFLMYVNICATWNGKKPKIVGGFKNLKVWNLEIQEVHVGVV